MELAELLERSAPYLNAAGFELTKRLTNRADGRPLPFGDQQWIFTAQGVDLEIVRDRSQLWVGLGVHGHATYNYQPWAEVAGIPFAKDLSLLSQIELLTS